MEKSGLQNAALVLEGGGFRGIYTTGVLDYLMEQGLYLPNVYGVSAGALNALGYAAKQPGRNAQINFRFCSDKRYVSVRNLLHYRSAFNLEFIFDVIPEKYIPFDYETFFSSEVQVHVGATNLLTGKCEFFTKEQMDRRFFGNTAFIRQTGCSASTVFRRMNCSMKPTRTFMHSSTRNATGRCAIWSCFRWRSTRLSMPTFCAFPASGRNRPCGL